MKNGCLICGKPFKGSDESSGWCSVECYYTHTHVRKTVVNLRLALVEADRALALGDEKSGGVLGNPDESPLGGRYDSLQGDVQRALNRINALLSKLDTGREGAYPSET